MSSHELIKRASISTFAMYPILGYVFLLPLQGILGIGSGVSYAAKLAMLSFAWLLLIFSASHNAKHWAPEKRLLFLIPIGYLLWAIVVYAWNKSPTFSFLEGAATALVISSAVLISQLSEQPDMRCKTLLFAMIGLSLALALCWLYFVTRLDIIPSEFLNRSRRLYGVMKSPNAVAYAAMVIVMLSIYSIYRKWISGHLAFILLLFGFASLFATLSRASIIAAAPAIIFFLANKTIWKSRPKLRDSILVTLVLAAIGVSAMFILDAQYKYLGIYSLSAKVSQAAPVYNPNPLLNALRIKEEIKETGNRVHVWEKGLQVARDHWFIGIGQANWNQTLGKYGINGFDSPHNGILEMFGGFGLGGLMLYVLTPLIIWRQKCEGDELRKSLLRTLVIFTLLRELLEVSTIFSYAITGMMFWLVAGLMV